MVKAIYLFPSSFLQNLFPLIISFSLLPRTEAAPTSSNATVLSDQATHRYGWTYEPDGRGTLGIIWSCLFTIFLCSWTVLCLNIPGPNDTRLNMFWRRCWLTTLCVLGPEFILQLALGQWRSARLSVQEFHRSNFNEGTEEWSMKHAFFADMGGFVLTTADGLTFPLDAKQLHFLISEKFVEYPKISVLDINDRNKVDGLFRVITTAQIFWFMLNIIARWIQHLLVTNIELTTLAFIIFSFFTTFCWAHKPADVGRPEFITTTATTAEILLCAGQSADGSYIRTPLECLSRSEWAWSIYWSHWINILRRFHITWAPPVKPADRLENTIFLDLPGIYLWLFLAMSLGYAAVFLSAWNGYFPTRGELISWRIASSSMVMSVLLYWLITQFTFVWYPALISFLTRHNVLSPPSEEPKEGLRAKLHNFAERVRNNSKEKDPSLRVPLKATIPMYGLVFLYSGARAYILLEDILQLRSIPGSAFETVNWISFLPHFS